MEKYDDVQRTAHLSSGQVIRSFHKSTSCYGDVCPVHNPSDHNLRGFPLEYNPMVGSFFRDVHGTRFIDPDDYNLNERGTVILKNAIKCNYCSEEIESEHRHDFKRCKCGASAVDGGSSYLRRVGDGNWEDRSIVFHKE